MPRLVCPHGHQWDSPENEAVPSDLARACPFCLSSQTLAQSTPEDGPLTAAAPAPAAAAETAPASVPTSVPGFDILEELSRGGMGVVYKARQLGLNRLVALKVITPDRLGHLDALNGFRREVQAAARLAHPHIVTVFHTDLTGPFCYLAMEFVNGVDLQRLVAQRGACEPAEAVAYIRQAGEALQHAYEQGLVHRDIKPGNLMVTPSPLSRPAGSPPGFLKVLDMGLARLTLDEAGQGELTQVGEFLGTPDYVSPEQADDPREADIRSDIYSLGGTLYFLLTGSVPFPGGSLMQKLRRHLTAPPPSARAACPGVPAGLDEVIARSMAKDPAARYQTPREMADALDRAATGRPVTAVPASAASSGGPTAATATRLVGHKGPVQAIAVSADGRFLLSGGLDETIRLWSLATFKELRRFSDPAGMVSSVHISPDARWAASCAMRVFVADMVVQVWDAASGRERGKLRGHKQNVTCVRFGPRWGDTGIGLVRPDHPGVAPHVPGAAPGLDRPHGAGQLPAFPAGAEHPPFGRQRRARAAVGRDDRSAQGVAPRAGRGSAGRSLRREDQPPGLLWRRRPHSPGRQLDFRPERPQGAGPRAGLLILRPPVEVDARADGF